MRDHWKIYLTVIVLVLGGIFEYLKTVDVSDQIIENNRTIEKELNRVNLKPFARNAKNKEDLRNRARDIRNQQKKLFDKIRNQSKAKYGQYKFPERHDFGNIPPMGKTEGGEGDEKDLKKKLAKAEAKLEAKKKKKKLEDEAKKKAELEKKKKEEAEKEKLAQEEEEESDLPEPDFDSLPNSTDPNDVVVAQENTKSNDTDEDNEGDTDPESPETLEKWMEIVLNDPNTDKVNQLVQAYLSGKVNASIFYTIVQLLAEDDKNQESPKLAVMALNATPSFQSFVVLTGFISGDILTSEARADAQAGVEIYKEVRHIGILASVVRNTGLEDDVRILALQLIEESARINLAGEIKKQGRLDDPEATLPNANVFDPLIPVLESQLSSDSNSSQFSESAQSTLTTLRQLLNA